MIDPFFSFQNNTVYYFGSSDVEYEDSIKTTDTESGKLRFLVEYSLDNISYETIVCEAIRFHIKHSVNSGYPEWVIDITLWPEIIFYLLYTTYSQFVKNLIEEEKYMETFQEKLLSQSYIQSYIKLKVMEWQKNSLFFSEQRVNRKERLLNLLSLTPFSKDESEKLVDNFLSTGDLKQIFSYYQQILKNKIIQN